jgi:hypothetical protein
MAVIKLNKMGGLYPSTLPRNLPNEGAQVAENLQPWTDEFRPMLDDTLAATGLDFNNPQTLYRFDRLANGSLNTNYALNWRSSTEKVSLVRQQLNDDTSGRIYYTTDTNITGTATPGLRWHNAAGTDRPASVPFPTTKLGVAITEGYYFTEEQKIQEVATTLTTAVAALRSAATPALVGLGANVVGENAPGWLRASDVGGSELDVIRVVAVNPGTLQIIDTYSSMTPAEAAWLLDPQLSGSYAEAPPGYTPPTWATGHTAWWGVPIRGLARAFTIDQVGLSAALTALDMPGTQGEQKLLTAGEVATIVAEVVDAADAQGTVVFDLIKKLEAEQTKVGTYANMGGAASLSEAVKAYFASTPVQNELDSAKQVFAEKMWTYLEAMGTAQAFNDGI